MSVKGMQTTIIATLLAKAVAEDGRDLSAGMFGPAVSKLIRDIVDGLTVPIDMVLHCPNCGAQHIDGPMTDAQYSERLHESSWWECGGDKPERWTNPPHRSHQCHACKGPDGKPFVWRPADVATNGVEAVKTRGKDDSPIVAPLWFLADESTDAKDDVWADAAEAYTKAAGRLRGHLEWRDRLRAAVRVLLGRGAA
jgi:hypothetical protein